MSLSSTRSWLQCKRISLLFYSLFFLLKKIVFICLSPDTASFVQKAEREREARDRGEVKDNRGFLAKYWMYIVPVVILVFLTSAAGPEGAPAGAAR